jgi:peptidoglycan/LPS O-acetylase OafA/YrhL
MKSHTARVPVVPSVRNSNGESLQFLDGLRGLAALYVVIGHARWLLWEGYSEGFLKHPDQYTAFGKTIVYGSMLFRYGHEAVLFFFVLSGFVIHLRYSKQLWLGKSEARFDWRSYVWRRAKRLYPPLGLALILTLLFDLLGRYLGYSIYRQSTPYPLINQNVFADHSWLTGVGNLAFVMTSYVPVWGTNGPLWSLKFEWWFYMIYPVFWWVSKKSITLATALMVGLWVASFYPAVWGLSLFREVFSMMLAWWFGVLLADIYTGRLRCSFATLSPLSLLLFALPFAAADTLVKDILWGMGFSGLISLCFVMQKRGGVMIDILERLKPLGDMSYTLYVIHFPLLVLMSGFVSSLSQSGHLPAHLGWVIPGICVCVLLAYLAHWLVEVPFVRRGKSVPAVLVHATVKSTPVISLHSF